MIEDTATLNACVHDGRYACVYCRRSIEDICGEITWESEQDLNEQVDYAVSVIAGSPGLASELLRGLILRRMEALDNVGGEPSALKEFLALLTGLVGDSTSDMPEANEVHNLCLRFTRLWSLLLAASVPDLLASALVQRLWHDTGEDGDEDFVHHIERSTVEPLRTLCRVLWIESPRYCCHVNGFLADATQLGDETEATYLRLLARSLWADLYSSRRAEILASLW